MNAVKTRLAQVMDFLPWTTLRRVVQRYGGDRDVKSITCAEQFRIMGFALIDPCPTCSITNGRTARSVHYRAI
jgi:hypothetical protein